MCKPVTGFNPLLPVEHHAKFQEYGLHTQTQLHIRKVPDKCRNQAILCAEF